MQHSFTKLLIKTSLCVFFITTTVAQAAQDIQLSGFGRLIAGSSQHDDVITQPYSDSISIKPDSLIAIQADWQLSKHWAATAQVIGHLDSDKNSGIEWLYLSYQPNPTTQFKLGRLRTPLFAYSDVIDVGYAYHWITPPSEVYASYLFSNYDGISVVKSFDSKHLSGSLEAFIGRYNGTVLLDGRKSSNDINDMGGISAEITLENITFRGSVITGILVKSQPEFQPSFAEIRALFATQNLGNLIDDVEVRGRLTFSQLGFSYDSFDYFVKGEWTNFNHDNILIPTIKSFYLSSGYQYQNFLMHLTYASREDHLRPMPNLVSDTAQYAQLHEVYQQLIGSRLSGDQHSLTAGIRWDFSENLALKTDVSAVKYGRNLSHDHDQDLILLVGVEWLF